MKNFNGMMSPNNHMDRTMGLTAVGAGIVIAGGLLGVASIYSSYQAGESADKAHGLAQDNMDMQSAIALEALKDKRIETAKLNAQKEIYRNMEFTNPYADVQNAYANMDNQFEGMENMYEDLTVDTKAADFQAQQGRQQRADILGALSGAAGGSGISGLAQSMANEGALQAKQISIDIGQQERQNQIAERGAAANIDLQQRQESGRLDQLSRSGEVSAEAIRLGGEASLAEREMNRQSTLLGMQMGQLSGANQAAMMAQQNQMSAGAAQANMYGQQSAAQYGMAGQMMSSGMSMVSAGGGMVKP